MLTNKPVVIHASIWLILLAVLFFVNARGQFEEKAIVVLVYGVLNIGIFYFQYFLVNPLIIRDNKYWRAIGYMLGLLLVSFAVKYMIALQFEEFILQYGEKEVITFPQYLALAFITGLFFMMLSTAVYVLSDSVAQRQQRKNLENEKLNAELAFLKSQINPHFLFNSLNNIYSLAYRKSEKTPDAILKLAEIMRYMLYESNEDTVLLTDEIDYLHNYIELQKLRFKGDSFVDIDVKIDRTDHRIMPLLLISFLENAFKHGVSADALKPIRILINVTNGRLHFKVENTKSRSNKDQTKGIGLVNLKRRLQLGYPDRHTINIVESDDHYSSELFLYL